MQIESTRPAVRVVMSDALERFAASMNQARPALNSPLAHDLAQAILVGRAPKVVAPPPVDEAPEEEETSTSSFGAFAFEEQQSESETKQEEDATAWLKSMGDSQPAQSEPKAKKPTSKKQGPLGLTRTQLIIVIAVLLMALCAIAAVGIFVLIKINNG
jgi:hypothetical protein